MSSVLIIEDDPSVMRLVSIVLRSEGYEVRTARDGFDGLQQVRQGEPDLILLDLSMPNMDGRTFIQIARRMDVHSRMVILSAFGAGAAADELHADGSVSKPFDPEDLIREVERLMPAGEKTARASGAPSRNHALAVYRS